MVATLRIARRTVARRSRVLAARQSTVLTLRPSRRHAARVRRARALESARAVEADFADGAHFVSLAALTRPEDVPAAIVAKLEIIVLSGESPAGAVERFLTAKNLLLVVDNFEQLLPAAPFIGALLAACPKLAVLATSREPLALAAEERYPVSPLALPPPGKGDDPETLASVDAVALFSERARAHDPDFSLGDGNAAVVAEICRRLDGLPLAIELAAARCGLLSPREIAERLDASLAGLAIGPRDAPARQQTLRATIDWSHELLSDVEQECFAALPVFAGGATVAAAETITHASRSWSSPHAGLQLQRRSPARPTSSARGGHAPLAGDETRGLRVTLRIALEDEVAVKRSSTIR